VAKRRGNGEDAIYFEHIGDCRDPANHRHCPGRWRGAVSLGFDADGNRIRKRVNGRNKTEVRAKLAELHGDLDEGVITQADYTVQKAIQDWLHDGLPGRSAKTVSTYREVPGPLSEIIGTIPLSGLTAADVPVGADEAGGYPVDADTGHHACLSDKSDPALGGQRQGPPERCHPGRHASRAG
jgi:hypothetical protein